MQRIASVMAQSTLIPESLYKEKDKELPLSQIISNCFLVVNQSVRWGLDPFAVAQSVAVVRGKLCYEGKLIAAVLDAKLSVRLHAAFTGDPSKADYRIFLSDTPWTEELIAQLRPGFSAPGMRIVDGSVSEWQTGEKSPWAAVKNYRRMLIYRGTRDWARFYEPAVLLGVYTPDEMMDLADNARAERAREIADRPSIAERLNMARIEQHEAVERREGFDPDFVTRETEDLSTGSTIDTDENSSASPSADEEGSGEASPHVATPDLSPSEPNSDDETGEPAGEATDCPDAAGSPVDPISPAIKLVMEECIDNMLRDAFSEPKDQQATKVDKLRSVFLEKQNLGDFPNFVNRCADTVLRIIGKGDEKDRAREYLMGRMPE